MTWLFGSFAALGLWLILFITRRPWEIKAGAPVRSRRKEPPDFFAEKHLKLVGIKTCRIDAVIIYAGGSDPHKPRAIRIQRVGAYDAGWVYIEAYCHTAKAIRNFSADRIEAFIDADGQCIEPRVFLTETLKLPLLKQEIRLRDRSTYGR